MAAIEDYALIGDLRTAALVERRGSIDWLCLPNLDSPACFAALLGDPSNGRWLLGPVEEATTTRRYDGNSLVLITTHETATGTVRVIDSMPHGDGRRDIVRWIEGVSGTVTMQHEWIVRFGYGRIRPWVHRRPDFSDYGSDELIVAIAGPDLLVLRGPRLPVGADGRHVDTFDVHEGDNLVFELTGGRSYADLPGPVDVRSRVHRSVARSSEWAAKCTYDGPYREAVDRSLVTLRALTNEQTGGIAAAASTSLPESLGGVRNWDYRFCWLRDAALTLEAMLTAGFDHTALAWRDWLVRAVAGDPDDLQVMYRIDGARELPEQELEHLPGYAGSRPVRIGNGAVGQRQSDVLGEVMIALAMVRDAGFQEPDESWDLQVAVINHLCEHWDEPDNGLWEIRGPQRHFTHSRVMMWTALDRAIRAVEKYGLSGPVDRWRELRDHLNAEIHERGFNAERGCFTQHYDTTEVDASLLMMVWTGFIEPTHPKFVGTVEVIEAELMRDGFLLRYRTESGVDGLPGDENPFLACSFWLVSAYAAMGRVDDAHELMRRLLAIRNDVGLLAEEYDPATRRLVGNFPQAFSHLGLIMAAFDLAAADTRDS